MKTAVVNIRKEPYYRREAIEKGLAKLGYTVKAGVKPTSREDLLILWNKKRGAEENAANQWEQQGGTVLILENGYLQQVDKTYYAISVHGHNGSGWFPRSPEDRFAKLGFAIKPWRSGDHFVVRAQRGVGSALMASPTHWAEGIAAKLRANGHRDTVLMQHPGDKNKLALDLKALSGCKLLHIWSSAMGIRALCEGVPVVHYAPRWIGAGAGINAQTDNRESVLRFMADGQWHFEEIATGEPFARIISRIGEARWA